MKYKIDIYSGKTFCGNAFCESIEECQKFLENDGFSDKGIIYDLETGKRKTIKCIPNFLNDYEISEIRKQWKR